MRVSPRLISVLLLGLLIAIGTFLILKATPEGLGLSDDSIAYVAGARSLIAGHGYREAWLASNEPVTHFPPGFSSVLAFLGLFGLDPLRGTRLVNALLFGFNAGLLGILVWRMTPSLLAGLVIAALFITNGEMLQVHAVAMSEPLFIFLSLLSFWMFDLYFERPPSSIGKGHAGEWWWLVTCGAFAGLAYLTRYAGLALAATFIVALLVLRSNWRKRLTSIGIFLGGFLPWAVGWAIRNQLVAGNATNRTFAWHGITSENLLTGRYVVSEFLIPVELWRRIVYRQTGIIEVLIVVILGSVLVWVAVKAWKYLSHLLHDWLIYFCLSCIHRFIHAHVRCRHKIQTPHPFAGIRQSAHSVGGVRHLDEKQTPLACGHRHDHCPCILPVQTKHHDTKLVKKWAWLRILPMVRFRSNGISAETPRRCDDLYQRTGRGLFIRGTRRTRPALSLRCCHRTTTYRV